MPVRVDRLIARGRQALESAGIETPALDVATLLTAASGLERSVQMAYPEREISNDQAVSFRGLIEQRAAHVPVSRLIGAREFWSLSFEVNEHVLDPRPDSETLVQTALDMLNQRGSSRIVDLGTGSGCLLLAVLSERKDDTGIGIDISDGAVETARRNADRLGLADRAEFEVGNWCQGLVPASVDLVLSNPPYIPSDEIEGLAPEVRDHDPRLALDGGDDGLAAYRTLIEQVPRVLTPGGALILEVGASQAGSVATLLEKAGAMTIGNHADFSGVDRCVAATF